jgi:hypothetical protein
MTMTCRQLFTAAFAAALLAISLTVNAQQTAAPAGAAGAKDTVAALKQSLAQGQALIRKYEWVETTIISLKGEEKARKQNRVYYGADGKLQKTPIGEAAPPKQEAGGRGGGRGRGKVKEQIVENKKEDMQEYMQKAVALVHQYLPPKPELLQAAKDAGRVTPQPQGDGRIKLEITQYLQPGDKLSIDVDAAASHLLGVAVDTYLEKKDDPVTLAVQIATLPDGAFYAAQTTLDAKAKNIRVVIQNSGYRPLAK